MIVSACGIKGGTHIGIENIHRQILLELYIKRKSIAELRADIVPQKSYRGIKIPNSATVVYAMTNLDNTHRTTPRFYAIISEIIQSQMRFEKEMVLSNVCICRLQQFLENAIIAVENSLVQLDVSGRNCTG